MILNRRTLLSAPLLLPLARASAQEDPTKPLLELPETVGYQARAHWSPERGFVFVYDQFDSPTAPRRIMAQATTDGKIWTDPLRLMREGLSASGPVLVQGADRAHLLYFTGSEDGKTYRAYMAVSTDGRAWSEPVVCPLRTDDANILNLHVAQTREGRLLCAYQFSSPEKSGIAVAESPDGRRWSHPVETVFRGRMRPNLLQLRDNSYLLAFQGRTALAGFEIFARRSKNLVDWDAEFQITADGNCHDAYLTAGKDEALVMYHLTTRRSPAGFDVAEMVSADGGATWSRGRLLTETDAAEYAPALLQGKDEARWLLYSQSGEGGKTYLKARVLE